MDLPARWLAGIVVAICGALLAAAPAARAQPTVWWQAQLGGLGVDNIMDVVAAGDRVYVTGWQTVSPGVTEWVTMAYEPGQAQGDPPVLVWSAPATYGGPWPGEAKPYALLLVPQFDPPGQSSIPARLAVTGQAPGPNGQLGMVTMILDPDTGNRHTSWPADHGDPDSLGLRRYVGPAGGPSIGRDVDYDFDGNLYVAGPSAGVNGSGQSTGLDYACVKITPSGHWSNSWPATATQPEAGVRRYNGPASGDDIAQQVLAPKKDHQQIPEGYTYWIYVGGTSWGGALTKNDVAILQINKDTGEFGIELPAPIPPNPGWGGPYRYHRFGGFNDVFAAMTTNAMHDDGDLLVALTSEVEWVGGGGGATLMGGPGGPDPVATHLDYTTLRLYAVPLLDDQSDTDPIHVWEQHYNGPGGLDDVAHGIAVGIAGGNQRVFTVGSSQAFGGMRAIKVVRYNVYLGDPDGWQEAHGRYSGGYGDDDGYDAALGIFGDSLYVVGASTRPSGGRDQVILKFNPASGALASNWPVFFGTAGLDDAATIVRPQGGHLAGHRRFVVGGWVTIPGQESNISIVQWRDDQ